MTFFCFKAKKESFLVFSKVDLELFRGCSGIIFGLNFQLERLIFITTDFYGLGVVFGLVRPLMRKYGDLDRKATLNNNTHVN